MNATPRVTYSLTATDVMSRDLVVVPRQMLVREATRLLHRAGASAAPVVDEGGRFVGIFSPADVFRWVEAGCPDRVVGPVLTCPYQVRGRLLNGDEAVICTLADGSCPYQAVQPTTAGRHSEICKRPEPQTSPFGTLSSYVTTDVAKAKAQTPFLELVRQIVDAHADRVVVLDNLDRPIGIVSATNALIEMLNIEREINCQSATGAICPGHHERSDPCSLS